MFILKVSIPLSWFLMRMVVVGHVCRSDMPVLILLRSCVSKRMPLYAICLLQIKDAFRSLVLKHHPDKVPAEQRQVSNTKNKL